MSDIKATWQRLSALAGTPVNILESQQQPGRLGKYSLTLHGLYADFSKHQVSDEVFGELMQLAAEAGVLEQARQMAAGAIVNTSEHRAALHMALRHPHPELPQTFIDDVRTEQEKMRRFSDAIRDGEWTGLTGKPFTDVINIGIGGSDLGPKMVCEALREYCDGPRTHFISNVDGAEINTLLKTLDAQTTLIVISSKTFTTQETLLNARTALDWLGSQLGVDRPAATTHCIGVTGSVNKAMEYGVPEHQLLTFSESIGGRYSVWSTIGFSICVAAGYGNFAALLKGGAIMDEHFLTAPPELNLPLVLGMFAIWYNNFLKAQTHAVIPYCQRLGLLVDHLQQVDMESNGKSATADGASIEVDTGTIIWGQTGTNGQHAFFQLLHQGTRLVPVDFIGVVDDPLSDPAHHQVLLANMIAQSQALMSGKTGDDLHRYYPGNRPSTTLLLDALTPETLGMLIALYEHRVFVQAAVWQINPFDQWGVELGKALASDILKGTGQRDPSTAGLIRRAGLPD